MQVKRINVYQSQKNNKNNSQQTFKMKMDTQELFKLPREEFGKMPMNVINIIRDYKSTIASMKPKNGTLYFFRSNKSTGYNHLDVELVLKSNEKVTAIDKTISEDLFNDSDEKIKSSLVEIVNNIYKDYGRLLDGRYKTSRLNKTCPDAKILIDSRVLGVGLPTPLKKDRGFQCEKRILEALDIDRICTTGKYASFTK